MGSPVIDPSISGSLLLTILVFILLIGSFFSMGVLRFFQQRKIAGFTYMGTSAVCIALFAVVVNMVS